MAEDGKCWCPEEKKGKAVKTLKEVKMRPKGRLHSAAGLLVQKRQKRRKRKM